MNNGTMGSIVSAIATEAVEPAVQEMTSRWDELVHEYSEACVNRVIRELDATMANIQSQISERVKAQFPQIIGAEVSRLLGASLGGPPKTGGFPLIPSQGNTIPTPTLLVPEGIMPKSEGTSQAPAWEKQSMMSVSTADAPFAEQGSQLIARESPRATALLVAEPEPEQALPFAVLAPSEQGLCQGVVELQVEADGCMRSLVRFMEELREKPEFRVLRLAGTRTQGMCVWIGLRQPLHLDRTLRDMVGVVDVSRLESPEPIFFVKLKEETSRGALPLLD